MMIILMGLSKVRIGPAMIRYPLPCKVTFDEVMVMQDDAEGDATMFCVSVYVPLVVIVVHSVSRAFF